MKQFFHWSRRFIVRLCAIALLMVTVGSALLFAVVSFIDTNKFKPQIQDYVQSVTGRKLTIDGDFTLGLGLSPTLTAHDVTFGNMKGGRAENMLMAESLSFSLSLPSLLQNKLLIGALDIKKAELFIEKDAKGKGNWQFASTTEDDSSSMVFDIASITIKNSVLHYYPDSKSQDQYMVDSLRIQMQNEKTLSIKGSVIVNELPLSFKGNVSRLTEVLDGRLSSQLALKSNKSSADIAINASGLYSTPTIDIKINAEDVFVNELISVEKAKEKIEKELSQETVFSEEPFNISFLKNNKVTLSLDVKKLYINNALFESIKSLVKVDKAHLIIDSLQANMAEGTLLATAEYDVQNTPESFLLSITGEHINLGELLSQLQASDQLEGGVLSFLLNVKGKGASSHSVAASLDGEFSAFVEDAKYNNNLDIGSAEGFFKLLVGKKDSSVMNINCAASIFDINQGTAKSKAIVIDATGAVVKGKGKIKLGDEEFALIFDPKAKVVGLADLATPMRLGGTFKNPKFFPDPKGVLTSIGKVAIGVATGGTATMGMMALDMAGKLGQAVKKNACTEALSSFVAEKEDESVSEGSLEKNQ